MTANLAHGLATTIGGTVPVDADTLERLAFNARRDIEIDGDEAFVTIDGTTFVAELSAVTK